jgi:hypothetical protein
MSYLEDIVSDGVDDYIDSGVSYYTIDKWQSDCRVIAFGVLPDSILCDIGGIEIYRQTR